MRARPLASPRLLLVLGGLAVAFGLAELALRALGYSPWQELRFEADVPLMHEPDPELGWRNKQGQYVFGPAMPIRMTFWADHSRATTLHPTPTSATAVVIGDSFVQGWAVSDDETFAWKLRERFPSYRFVNLGCAGYGTTQSLLALKRYLAETNEKPALVLYGFSDFHAGRNTADGPWLKSLAQLSYRGHVAVPYAELEEGGRLSFHAPVSFPAWPLHRWSSLVATAEAQWATFTARARKRQEVSVTQAQLLELDRIARDHGARLVVAILSEWVRNGLDPYRRVLADNGIVTAECLHPRFSAPEMQVPVYGHPNAIMNAYWAACIERTLRQTLESPGGAAGAAPSAAHTP